MTEQIILETALSILKCGLKGCPGGERKDKSFRLVCFCSLLRVYMTDDIPSTETSETLITAPYTGSDIQQVVSQCPGSQTNDQGLKSIMYIMPVFLCLI